MNTQIFSAIFDIVSTPMSGPSLTSVSQVSKTFSSQASGETPNISKLYFKHYFYPFNTLDCSFKIIFERRGWATTD